MNLFLKSSVEMINFRLFNKMIKNIVFEDTNAYPSPVANLLINKGFSILRIEKGWLNLTLKDPYSPSSISSWEAVNYVATLDVEMLKKRLSGLMYNCIFV